MLVFIWWLLPCYVFFATGIITWLVDSTSRVSKTARIIQPKIHEKPSRSLGTSDLPDLPDHQAQEGDIGDFSALLEALQGAEAGDGTQGPTLGEISGDWWSVKLHKRDTRSYTYAYIGYMQYIW